MTEPPTDAELRALAEAIETALRNAYGDVADVWPYWAALLDRLAAAEGLRTAAEAAVDAWDEYVEAHARRGHKGPHVPEPLLGDCGQCVSSMYGTEVQMGEYAMPALRAALAPSRESEDAR